MKIRVAELNIEIINRYPYLAQLCREYVTDFDRADITVAVTDAEIDAELKQAPYGITRSVAEATCAYRQIALRLPVFDAFVFHASVVACYGVAYAFAAASGVGKSTHTALWLKQFGDRAQIVNGDKPIFRFINGQLRAFGTPWQGKENQGANTQAPLGAVCFLERGAENKIRPLNGSEVIERLAGQILMPVETEAAVSFLNLLDRMLRHTPTYLLCCNTKPEAAMVAYQGMKKEN